jgi:hypothetical protein
MTFDSETPNSAMSRYMLETNHERTLYVRYMFRNCLIYRECGKVRGTGANAVLKRAVATPRKALLPRPSAPMVGAREVPVPQRDSQAATNPDG